MSHSKIYYESPTVKVEQDFLITTNSRYPLKNVNGVFVSKQANYRRLPVTLGIFELTGGLILSIWFPTLGGICLFIALAFFLVACSMKTKYVLRLKTAFGETRPIISFRSDELDEIKQAILLAIYEKEEKK